MTGADAVVEVDVPVDLPYFDGHFPAWPVLPGAALLCHVVLPAVTEAFPDLGLPRGLRRVRFNRTVAPGDRLTVTLNRRKEAETGLSFQVSRRGEPVGSGQVFFQST